MDENFVTAEFLHEIAADDPSSFNLPRHFLPPTMSPHIVLSPTAQATHTHPRTGCSKCFFLNINEITTDVFRRAQGTSTPFVQERLVLKTPNELPLPVPLQVQHTGHASPRVRSRSFHGDPPPPFILDESVCPLAPGMFAPTVRRSGPLVTK